MVLQNIFSLVVLIFVNYYNFSFAGRNVCVVGENQSFQTDNKKESLILGIETSCDDTGAAIVDSKGNVLGEALHSQLQTHLE